MGATQSSDFSFAPKVWQEHIGAYFDKKLVFGAYALHDNTLTAAPGETVNFPYFKAISAAQEPSQDEGLAVDKLQDDSFSATVKEVGKAVGFKKKALRVSAARQDRIFGEAQDQMARVHAEKVDADLITEINTSGSYVAGFVGTGTSDVANITNINVGRITGFGDKADQAVAIFMHSYHLLSLLNDSTSGFLKADAMPSESRVDVPGWMGKLLGMDVIVTDQCPRASDISGKQAYYSFIVKRNAYGFMTAENMDLERDYDILHREWVVAATQWYAVKAFHAKIASNDYRICRSLFCTAISA